MSSVSLSRVTRTIPDITSEIVLDVEYSSQSKSPYGLTSLGFEATLPISHKEEDLTSDMALKTDGWLVWDEINISIQLEIIKQGQEEALFVA